MSFKQFYMRRVLRIFPPFYLILGVTATLVTAGVFVGDAGLVPVTTQFLHLSNYQLIVSGYHGYPLGTYTYWSLAVEEHFYLLFPVVYLFLRRYALSARRQALVLLAVCGLVLLWRCVLVFGLDVSKDRTYIATDTRMDSILFGCVLAIWCNPVLDPRWVSDRLLKYVLLPVSCLVLIATFFAPEPVVTESFRYTIQGLALAPVFTAAMLFPTWGPFRLLNLPAVRFMGLLSYSLYLMHEIAIYNLYPRIHANHAVQATVVLAVCVALASAIYVLIERPCARLRGRLSYRAYASPTIAGAGQAETMHGRTASGGARPAQAET